MRLETRVIVVVVLGVIAVGSHLLLEGTGKRTLGNDLSPILIAVVAVGLIGGLMAWARRR